MVSHLLFFFASFLPSDAIFTILFRKVYNLCHIFTKKVAKIRKSVLSLQVWAGRMEVVNYGITK